MTRRSMMAMGSAALIAGAAPRSAWGRTQADIVIIGAGLSGLHAASLLEAQGLKVIVVEGDTRLGGRMHSLDDLPGSPEAGGVQIGSGYQRVLALTNKHGVAVEPAPMIDRNILYHIGGQSMASAAWPTAPTNRLPQGAERALAPAALGPLYSMRMPKLAHAGDWMTSDGARYDIPYATALAQLGASAEAIRLIGANLNGNNVTSLSALHVARTAAIFRASPGPLLAIAGGSQRLPEAMAAALRVPPQTGKIVTGIGASRDQVTIELADGSRITARHALCTIPFSALRNIKLSGVTDPQMTMLIKTLPYTHASFAYLSAREPFWRNDGLPETLWSDDPLIGRVFILGDNPAMLKVWLSGPDAAQIDRADARGSNDIAEAIIAKIEDARPSAKGKLKLARLYSWQNNPMARGIYHHIGAGQAAQLAHGARHVGTRLHFAGEHLAWESAGMEAALESAERVSKNILQHM